MKSLDSRLHEIKKELEGLLLSLDPRVFNFSKNSFDLSGKAVRSRFTLLFSEALGLDPGKARGLAVCAELVHTASLLHDDCVDNSSLRRGRKTLNARFGANTAILLGDLMMTAALNRAGSVSADISSELVLAVKKMAEGALMEENFKFSVPKLEDYEAVVSRKTSALFRWSALSACYLSKSGLFEESSRIAEAFGLSFQITDDALDLEENPGAGKDTLKDITEGKITLPILIAVNGGKDSDVIGDKLLGFLKAGKRDFAAAAEIAGLVRESGSLEKAREKARKTVESVRKDVMAAPDKNAAAELYNYMYSLAERRN